jgi:hypothetical protein
MNVNGVGGTCGIYGEKRDAYRVLVGKLEVLSPLEGVEYMWVNTKMDLKEMGEGGMH